jgi:putative ABC transport system permease protein
MPDGFERRLGACLPAQVRTDIFEPALRDLQIERLGRDAGDRVRLAAVRRIARVLLLFLDCWRIAPREALLRRRENTIVPPAAPPAREPVVMILYYFRHAVRQLRRAPGFALTATLTLALGIGANVAVFAVLEAVVLRPLPYVEADDLVFLRHRDDRTGIAKWFIAIGDYIDLAAGQTALEGLHAYGSFDATIYDAGEPFRVRGLTATPGLFEMLRVQPALGRTFRAEEGRPGAPPVMMLGYDLWESQFGSDPSVIGRRLRIGTAMREIVGVTPRNFRFPPQSRGQVVLPFPVPAQAPAQRKSNWVFAVGRMKPGVTSEQVTAQLASLSRRFAQQHPTQNEGSVYDTVPLRDALIGDTRRPLLLMQAAVVLVLLIACVNVANLLLVRSLARRTEMAVRAALGASRWRLALQVLSETMVLCTAGGALGILIAWKGVPLLIGLVPKDVSVPGIEDAGINVTVLTFALAAAIASALVFTLIAVAATGRGQSPLVGTARAGVSRGARRATSGLVIAEMALAVVLLMAAGLILRSFSRLLAVDPGFRIESVLTMDLQLPAERYREVEARRLFYQRAFDELRQSPLVVAAGAASVTPLTGNKWTSGFDRSDRPVAAGQRPPDVGWQSATGGYFEALEVPLKSGRYFDVTERSARSPLTVIVSEAIEKKYFPGESAVGRKIRSGDGDAEIVGVVGDIRRASLADEPWADLYYPFDRVPSPGTTLFIRTTGDAAAATPEVQRILKRIEPGIVFPRAITMAALADESVASTRLTLWLLGVFAIVALSLAAVGVYGVMSYAVRQRSREIGTRMALGATRSGIAWMVMRQGGLMIVLGACAGLATALTAVRSLGSLLYDVPPSDLGTIVTTITVLSLIMAIACWVPARRAAAVDPARTLAD